LAVVVVAAANPEEVAAEGLASSEEVDPDPHDGDHAY
jgi:hypothetical protein